MQDDPGLGATGINFVSFGPDAGAGVTTMTRSLRIVAGGNGELSARCSATSPAPRSTWTARSPSTRAPTRSSRGSARRQRRLRRRRQHRRRRSRRHRRPPRRTLRLMLSGNNTFSGGFDPSGGTVVVNSDTAFGTGLLTVTAARRQRQHHLRATSRRRARSPTPCCSRPARLIIGGDNPFTFTGNGALGGTLLDVLAHEHRHVQRRAQRGLRCFKEGAGTVVLSGNNNFNGTLSAGFNAARPRRRRLDRPPDNTAAGSPVGQTQVIGASSIGMPGGINDPRRAARHGQPHRRPRQRRRAAQPRRQQHVGRPRHPVDLAASPGGPSRGSAGADAGATLNIGGSVFGSGDTDTTFTFTKFGPGQVNVGAEQFVATRSGGATSSVQRLDRRRQPPRRERGAPGDVAQHRDRTATSPTSAASRLNGSSQFDLTNNALVVDYDAAGPTPYADIRAKIVSGYDGGAWNGPGIISSQGNTSTHGVGYAEASNVLTFTGTPPDALVPRRRGRPDRRPRRATRATATRTSTARSTWPTSTGSPPTSARARAGTRATSTTTGS